MPTFTATLSDGREVEFEADQEPTHDELLAALSSWKEPSTEVPAGNEIPKIGQEDLTEQAAIGGRQEDWQMEATPGLGIKTALQIPGAYAQDWMNKLVESGGTPSAVRDAIRQQREPAFVPEPPTPIFERGGGLENVGAVLRGEPFDSATTAAFKPLTEYLPEGVRTGIEEFAKERGESATSPLSLATGGLATIPLALLPKSVAESNPLTRPLAPKVGGGISKGILHIAEGFTSPVGLATLGMGSLPGAAQRAVSLAFAADMATAMPELATQLGDEFGKPPEERDNAKIAELLTSAVGTAAFTTLAAKHGLTPRKPAAQDIFLNQRDQPTIPGDFRAIEQPTTGVPNASRVQETTAVHGDVRTQPIAGERQVPAEEGGGGVQPRAAQAGQEGQQGVLLTLAEKAKAEREAKTRLSEENQRYLTEERAAIDNPVEVVAEIPEGHPFAGLVASIDPKSGRILINPERLKTWLDSIAPERRRQAVRSMLSEERIHLATPPDAARSYGATLTAAEKAITQRIYGGKHWRENPLDDLQLGHEALRYRMQQLTRMTPREVAEAALRERWTVQGLDIVARTIQGTREALGTKASKEGLAILGQIEKNLGIAQAAIASGAGAQPGVTMKERVEKAEADERKGLFNKPTKVPVTVEGPDGKTYQATFDGIQDWSSIGRGKLNQVTLLEEIPGVSPQHGTTYAESLSKKGYTVKGIPEEAPGVRQKKGREDTSEQQFMFLPPVPKGAAIERPTAVESGAEAITPAKVSSAATEHLTQYPKPSFDEFTRETKRRFGDVQPGQLRDAWEDAAWKRVTEATGPELEVMRESLKLARNYGRREVAGAQEATLPPSLEGLNREARKRAEEARRITTSRQNYRKSVQSAIARKLIEQSYEGESLKKALGRRELTSDDLATNRPKMFEEISAEDAASPERLGRIILENFRASSSLPETNTRRVVALVNRKTGQTSLVSVYNHPRTGAMVVNPASSTSLRPNVSLASVLKDYRAIATALLDEPVKNFSQRFGSVSEFNAKFADDARNAVQAQASYESSLGETAGIIEPEGPQGPIRERPLTDAEAGSLLDHFYNANEGIPIESKENVRIAMSDVADLADLGEKPHTVFAAYLKLYERIREDHPDFSEGEAIDRMADQIYEDNKASKTREDFVARTMGRYQGQAREAVQAGKPATTTGARELTMMERVPPTVVRPEQIPPEAAAQMQQAKAAREAAQAQLPPEDAPGAFAKAREGLPPLEDNYLKDLSFYTPKLYRETSVQDAQTYFPNSRTYSPTDQHFMANTPEMALGQGKNRGVLLEFASKGIEGQVAISKPGWDFAYKNGSAEFVARHIVPRKMARNLSSVTVMNGASGSRTDNLILRQRLRELEHQGWKREQIEGGVKWISPELPASDAPGMLVKDAGERAKRLWSWAKPPGVVAPEAVDVDFTHAVPRFPKNVNTALTRATGIERIPIIGKLWGPRANIRDQADRETVGYAVKRSMGKSLSALAGKEINENKRQLGNPFTQAKDGAYTNLDADTGASLYPSDVFESWQRQQLVPEAMAKAGISQDQISSYRRRNPEQYRFTPEQEAQLRNEYRYVRDGYDYLAERRQELADQKAQAFSEARQGMIPELTSAVAGTVPSPKKPKAPSPFVSRFAERRVTETNPRIVDFLEEQASIARQAIGDSERLAVPPSVQNAARLAGAERDMMIYPMPRPVLHKKGANPIKAEVQRRIGGQYQIEKERRFETEKRGAEDYAYEPDVTTRIVTFMDRVYKAVADGDLANSASFGGKTVAERRILLREEYKDLLESGEMKPETVEHMAAEGRRDTEATVANHPAFVGKVYPIEMAQKLTRAFGDQSNAPMRAAHELSTAQKGLMLTADMAQYTQQGLPLMLSHPRAWGRATERSLAALTNPHVLAQALRNPALKQGAMEFVQNGGSLGRLLDFVAGAGQQEFAARIPVVRHIVSRSGQSFGAFLDLSKLHLWQALKESTPKDQWPKLAETVENITLSGKMEGAGLHPVRAMVERILFMAPSYYRAALQLVADAAEGGARVATGRAAEGRPQVESFKAVSSMIGALTLAMGGAYYASGMSREEIRRRLTPGGRTYLTYPVKVGDRTVEIGPGGIVIALANLAGEVTDVTLHRPKKLVPWGPDNPLVKFLINRLGPLPSLVKSFVTGKDYSGRREIGPVRAIGETIVPISGSTAVQAAQKQDKAAAAVEAGASFIGLRGSTRTTLTDLRDLVNDYLKQSDDPTLRHLWETKQKQAGMFSSDYSGLRRAIANENQTAFRKEYDRLLEFKTDQQIADAMESDKPITGLSEKDELEFVNSLTDSELKMFEKAQEDREALQDKFTDMLRE